MKHKYELLVFDWDGTLIDSLEQIVISLQSASKKICGIDIAAQAAKSVIGLGLHEAIEALHPNLEQTLIEQIAAAYKQHYLYENPIQPRLFEGIRDMLDTLIADKFSLAIATGKSRAGLDRSLHEHGLEHYFVTTRCAGENRSKPHPEMLTGIMHDMNGAPRNTLMIGDSEHDLMMAKHARVDAIAVTDDVHLAKILLQHHPLTCLDKITDLYDFLSHNNETLTC